MKSLSFTLRLCLAAFLSSLAGLSYALCDGTANRFHSPNQVQVEFLCDVADQSQSWVPTTVRLRASADANARAATRFINGPGYSCGSFRPW